MLADVLFTHSNHLFHDPKQVEKMQPYPPLQTMLAAAVLREAGVSAAICDTTFDEPYRAFERSLFECSPRMVVVCEDNFNFLSKMCLARNRELSFSMARMARRRGVRIAVHGSDSSDHPLEYLAAGFDYVLLGEVEETLRELASGKPLHLIAGLMTARGTRPGARRLRTELDSLPEPARDLVDLEPYRAAWEAAHGYFSLNMVSSRGCPYRCNWCAKPIWGDSYHVRSPRLVAGEMLHMKRAYNPGHIWFADDIFALSRQWTLAFAAAVQECNAATPFKMQSRCDLMTRDTAAALHRAGCAEVWMGAESGSQRILDAMDKGLRVEAIYQARENLRRHGIRACFFLQFGYPGESWEDIDATLRMLRETRPDDIGVSVSYPLPGTRFYQLVSDQLGRKANWCDSGDLAMMFQGTYRTEFYRALADAVHAEVRRPAETEQIRLAWMRVFELECASTRAVEVAL
ncbi:MAG: radical SAM protein [Acidobacteriota bacterium]|nr:radical SAM protein [Acidobacteriota bacterium]